MAETFQQFWTAVELAPVWRVHRSSIPRIMARFGFSGIKFRAAKQAARRYADHDVKIVEKLAALTSSHDSTVPMATQTGTSEGGESARHGDTQHFRDAAGASLKANSTPSSNK